MAADLTRIEISRNVDIVGTKLAVTLFVIDHSKARRATCVRLLQSQREMRVIGESQSAAETISFISKVKPNIVLLDLDLALESGQLLQILRRESPRTKVILLTGAVSQARILKSLSYGVLGCIKNRDLASFLTTAVRVVDAGEAWVPRSLVSKILEQINKRLQQ